MGNHCSGVVWGNVVSQPAVALGLVERCWIVAFVTGGIGNGITENLVN
jgi:hypothetical protein